MNPSICINPDHPNNAGYFPLKIYVIATDEIRICKTIDDLPIGVNFNVIETNTRDTSC